MKYRLLFAVGFVVLVSGLIAARDHGFLGGREVGGPLRVFTARVSSPAREGQIVGFGMDALLRGGPVRVQNVRARIVSPELELLGPDVARASCGACVLKRWPPRGGRRLEGVELARARASVLVGLRAQRAGLYYAVGFVTDYRRGQRRFRDREASQSLCIAVHTHQRCSADYDGPGEARVAQVGGPSRYHGAHFTEHRAVYAAPGDYTVQLTVTNRTRSAITVSRVSLDRNPAVRLTATEPVRFHLAPGADEGVRLHWHAAGCAPDQHITFDRLRADLDGDRRSIPLSLPLEFRC